MRAERGVEVLTGGELDGAVERVSGVHSLQLDQAAPGAILGARHRPHQCDFRHRAAVCQKFPFAGVGGPIGQPRLDVAAEEVSGIRLDGGADRSGDRADRGDRGHTKDEAAEKDAEAPHAAAQLASGEPEGI